MSKAAKELGMSRSTIYRKMEKYKILAPNAMDDISH
ncbi:helix-turn-helix domain-containing protein [Acinetobacter baumannii]